MTFLLLLAVAYVSATFNAPFDKVLDTTKKVLEEKGFTISSFTDNELVTETVDIDINKLGQYTVEHFPAREPGWTRARCHLNIRISETENKQTEIKIDAIFERFGVPDVLLLIPPHWSSVSSNGNLENEIIDAIEGALNVTNRGKK